MTEPLAGRDPLLEESNRAAHRVAKAAGFYQRWRDYGDARSLTIGEFQQRAQARRALAEAVVAYEEIERRAQREAGG